MKVERILLIDDEESVVFALRLLLQALGFNVREFSAPEEAIKFLQTDEAIDLCLCDLKMPKVSGLGVLKEARKVRPSMPFVLMSAHANTEEVAQAMGLGATGFLSKPFSPDELKQLIESIN